MYFDSTGGATTLLSNYAVTVSEIKQELSQHSLVIIIINNSPGNSPGAVAPGNVFVASSM